MKKIRLRKQRSYHRTNHSSPIIIELSGTPNSGKTTALSAISDVMTRNQITHTVIQESASRCLITDKLSPEFNYWTASDTIQRLIRASQENIPLILCERGLFDALTWLDFHFQRNQIPEAEFIAMNNLYLLYQNLLSSNYVLIMKCSSDVSILREYAERNTYYGTIINPVILNQINDSINRCTHRYHSHFSDLQVFDTSNMPLAEAVTNIITEILSYLAVRQTIAPALPAPLLPH